MNKELIGKFVITIDGHSGVVIKQFKPTGRSITIHIKFRPIIMFKLSFDIFFINKPPKKLICTKR